MAQPPKGAASLSKHIGKGKSTINPKISPEYCRCYIPVKDMETHPKLKNAGIDGATPKKATHPGKKLLK